MALEEISLEQVLELLYLFKDHLYLVASDFLVLQKDYQMVLHPFPYLVFVNCRKLELLLFELRIH